MFSYSPSEMVKFKLSMTLQIVWVPDPNTQLLGTWEPQNMMA